MPQGVRAELVLCGIDDSACAAVASAAEMVNAVADHRKTFMS